MSIYLKHPKNAQKKDFIALYEKINQNYGTFENL
jgi:hypothetical protein